MNYEPILPFFDYQREDFSRVAETSNIAVLYEQGLGKTKMTLDNARYLHAHGEIEMLLVVAPSGVHTNWITDEVPKHAPDVFAASWSSNMTAKTAARFRALFDDPDDRSRLRLVAMNVEAFQTPERYYRNKAGAICSMILQNFRTMMVIDESSECIKGAGSTRTKRLIGFSQGKGQKLFYRRILDGTPIDNAPLDLYAPFRWLSGRGAPLLGHHAANKTSFERRYAITERRESKHINPRTGQPHTYDAILGFKNMDELKETLALCSIRRTKAEDLDLPPQTYIPISVDLSSEQKKLYIRVRKDKKLVYKSGREEDIEEAITVMMRLQQIVGGFIPTEDPENREADPIHSDMMFVPRFARAVKIAENNHSGKTIIACRFLSECKAFLEYFGESAESYIGLAHYKNPDQRDEGKARFQNDDSARVLVMNEAGFRGLTLTQATTMIFYSNVYRYGRRKQAEDRIHRSGQTQPVSYYDIFAEGTIDELIRASLREKKNVADLITGDTVKEWL